MLTLVVDGIRIDIQLHCFTLGCQVFPEPLNVETVASLLFIIGALVGNELNTYMSVSSWALYYVPFICVSLCISILYRFDLYSFVIHFEFRKPDTSSFILSPDGFGYSRPSMVLLTLYECCFYFWKCC